VTDHLCDIYLAEMSCLTFNTKIVWMMALEPFIKLIPMITDEYARYVQKTIVQPLLQDIQDTVEDDNEAKPLVEVRKFIHLMKAFAERVTRHKRIIESIYSDFHEVYLDQNTQQKRRGWKQERKSEGIQETEENGINDDGIEENGEIQQQENNNERKKKRKKPKKKTKEIPEKTQQQEETTNATEEETDGMEEMQQRNTHATEEENNGIEGNGEIQQPEKKNKRKKKTKKQNRKTKVSEKPQQDDTNNATEEENTTEKATKKSLLRSTSSSSPMKSVRFSSQNSILEFSQKASIAPLTPPLQEVRKKRKGTPLPNNEKKKKRI